MTGKNDDPKALRARIAELEKENAELRARTNVPSGLPEAVIEAWAYLERARLIINGSKLDLKHELVTLRKADGTPWAVAPVFSSTIGSTEQLEELKVMNGGKLPTFTKAQLEETKSSKPSKTVFAKLVPKLQTGSRYGRFGAKKDDRAKDSRR